VTRVVTASTGNHGRAVAHAARAFGIEVTVCMSSLVPANKVDAVAALGARIVIAGDSQDDAQAAARQLVRDEGYVYVPPFDDPHIVAGQATIGVEILEALPDAGTLVVPLSGGGLFSGVAFAAKAIRPSLAVIGVSMARGAAMHASIAAGHPVDVDERPTLADSLGGGIGLHNRYTFEMTRALIDEIVLLDEPAIARGIAHAYREERLVVEGAGAVGIAALLDERIARRDCDGPIVVVVSGANIDMGVHRRIVSSTDMIPPVTLLDRAQLRTLVPLDVAAIDQIEAAFASLATEAVAMPPILNLALPERHGEVDVKTAYLPRFDSFAIKVSPGFFDNPSLGLPSLNGLMLVLSARTGLTEAVLLDNGYLTAVRTAAAGAVAARRLARRCAPRGHRRRGRAGAAAARRADARARHHARDGLGARCRARGAIRGRRTRRARDRRDGRALGACRARRRGHRGHHDAQPRAARACRRSPCGAARDGDGLRRALQDRACAVGVRRGALLLRPAAADARRRRARACDRRGRGRGRCGVSRTRRGDRWAARGRTQRDDITICDLTGTGAQDTAIAVLALQRARAARAGTIFNDLTT
jgi:threonine dehydratase